MIAVWFLLLVVIANSNCFFIVNYGIYAWIKPYGCGYCSTWLIH